MGAQGREHVRRNFLSTRELEDWLGSSASSAQTSHAVIVVSHRGPVPVHGATADGIVQRPIRGAGGVVERARGRC